MAQHPEHTVRLSQRLLSYCLISFLILQPVAPALAAAITPVTPGTQVDQAGNGVPLINIATPNAAGVSHNQYQDYNVGKEGVILNNATGQLTATQLGGLVQNNPNLKAGQEAKAIINEVTGTSRSQLQGYTEVAGKAASVMVANPYGITCSGCGFINTPAVTLTTGKPQLDANGNLQSLNVTGGSITIDGNGLDTSKSDSVSIISRAAEINAQLYAKDLSITTGANRVDASGHVSAISGTGPVPVLAVDTGALGGMYADRIRLVSGEKGVGVNLGNLNARQGDIRLDANGKLTLNNTLASGTLTASAPEITLTGSHQTGQTMTLTSQGDTTLNNATLASGGDLTLNSAGQLSASHSTLAAGVNAQGKVSTNAGLSVTAARQQWTDADLSAQDVQLTAQQNHTIDTTSRIRATRDITLNAGNLALNGQLNAGRDTTLTATTLNAGSSSRIDAQHNVALTLADNSNWQGQLVAGQDLTLKTNNFSSSGLLLANGNLSADIGQWTNSATLQSLGSQWLNMGSLNSSGQFLSGNDLTLTGRQAITLEGLTSARNNLTLTTPGGLSLGTGGQLLSDGGLWLNGGNVLLDGQIAGGSQVNIHGTALTSGNSSSLSSKGNLTLSSGETSLGGQLSAQGDVSLNAAGLTTRAGSQLQGHNLTLSMQQGQLAGNQAASGDLQVTSAGNLSHSGTLNGQTVGVRADQLDNSGSWQTEQLILQLRGLTQQGSLLARQGMTLNADRLTNRGSIAATDLTLMLNGAADNQNGGKIVARNGLTFNSASLNNSGTLSSDNVKLNSTVLYNNGLIQGQQALDVRTTGLNNTGNGQLLSAGTMTLSGKQATNGGLWQAQTLNLTADSLDNRGELNAGMQLLHLASALNNQTGGRIVAQQGLTISAPTLTNDGTLSAPAVNLTADTLTNRGLLQGDNTLALALRQVANLSAGKVLTGGSLALDVPVLKNNGLLQVGGDLTLTGDSLDNSGDISARTLTLHHSGAQTHNAGAKLQAQLEAVLSAATLTNNGSVLADRLSLTSDTLVNGGQLQGTKQLDITTTTAGNSGKLLTDGALTVKASSLNNGGTLQGEAINLTGDSADNSGSLTATTLLLHLAQQFSNQPTGSLIAHQGLTLSAPQLRNSGTLAAKVLSLTATTVDNSGQLQGDNTLLLAATSLANQRAGQIITDGNLTLALPALTNAGLVDVAGDFTLDGEQLDNQGNIAARNLTLRHSGTVSNQAEGTLLADQTLTLSAGTLNNEGRVAAERLNVTAAQLSNSRLLQGAQQLDITAANAANQGQWLTAGNLNASIQTLNNSGLLQGQTLILKGDSVDNSGQLQATTALFTLAKQFTLQRTGKITAQQGLTLNTPLFTNHGIMAASTLTLSGSRIDNSGLLQGDHGLQLTATQLDNQTSGEILSGDGLTLTVPTLTNAGLLSAGGDLALTGHQLDNSGEISARNLIVQTGDTLTNQEEGDLLAKQALTLTSHQMVNNGNIQASRLTLNTSGLKNKGLLQGAQRLDMTADNASNEGQWLTADTLNASIADLNNGGLVQAGQITLKGNRLDNSGQLKATNALIVMAERATNQQQGKVLAQHEMTFSAPLLSNRGILAADMLNLSAGTSLNNSGLLQGDSGLTLTTALLNNLTGGQILTTGNLQLALPTLVNSGLLSTKGDLSLKGNLLTNSGELSSRNLTLEHDGTVTNQAGGALLAQQQLNLAAGTLTNSGNVAASQLSVTATTLNNSGLLQGAQQLDVAAASASNQGQWLTAGNLSATASTLASSGLLQGKTVTLRGNSFDNSGQLLSTTALLSLAKQFTNRQNAKILAQQGLTLSAPSVANSGTLAATALTLSGTDIDNSGLIQGDNGFTLTSAGALTNQASGILLSDGTITLDTAQLTNEGLQQAKVLGVTAGKADNHGNLLGSDAVTLKVNDTLTNSGQMLSQQALQLTAKNVTNDGLLAASQLQLDTGTTLNQGTLQGNQTLLHNGNLTNQSHGQLLSGGTLTLNGAAIDNAGRLQGQQIALSGTSLTNSGNATGSNGVTATLTGNLSNTGLLLSQQAMDVRAQGVTSSGTLAADRLSLNVDSLTNSGLLQGNSSLTLLARTLNNQTAGQMLTGGPLSLTLSTLINAGLLQVKQGFTLKADSLTHQGTLKARSVDLTLGDLTTTTDSHLLAEQNLTLNTATLTNGGVLAADTVSLNGGDVTNSGLLQGNQWLTLNSGTLSNQQTGQLLSGGGLTLSPTRWLDNAGLLQGQTLTVNSGSWNNRGSALGSNGVTSTLGGAYNGSGQLLSQGSLALSSQTFTNSGQLAADRLQLTGRDGLTNSGLLQGNSHLTLTGAGLNNQAGGQVLSTGNLRLDAAAQTNAGLLLAGQTLDLIATTLSNSGTLQAGTLQLATSQQLTNLASGTLLAQNGATLSGALLDNRGQLAANNLTVNNATVTNSGLLQGASALTLTNTTLTNLATGRLLSGGALSLVNTGFTNEGTVQGQTLTLNAATATNRGSLLGTDALTATLTDGLLNSGQLLSHGAMRFNSGWLTNDGALLGEGDVTLTGNQLTNRGNIQGNTLLLGNGQVDNSGTVIGLHSLTLQATAPLTGRLLRAIAPQKLTNNGGGKLLSQGTLSATGGSVINNGSWQGQRILLNAQQLQNSGSFQSADALTLAVTGSLDTATGSKLIASGLASLQAATYSNQGQWLAKNLIVRGGSLDNRGDISGVEGLDIALSGGITVQRGTTLLTAGNLALSGASVTNLGRVQGANVTLNSGALTNDGTIQADGGLDVTLNGDLSNSASGNLLSQNTLRISGNNLTSQGMLQSGGDMSLTGAQSTRNDGQLLSGGLLTLITPQLTNNNWLQAGRLTFGSGMLGNNGSLLISQQGILGGSSLTNQGTLQGGNLTLNYNRLDNNGTLYGGQSLAVTSTQVNNGAGAKLYSAGDLSLNSNGLNYQGQIAALGNLTLSLGSDFTLNSQLAAGQMLSVSTTGNLVNNGTMQGQGLRLSADGALTNNSKLTAGYLTSQLSGGRIDMNAAGSLQAGGNVTLLSRSDINNNGFTGTAGDLTLNAPGAINNNSALLYAGNNLQLLANLIHNQRGDILAGNSLWMQRDAAGNANSEVINTSGTIETQNGDITIRTGHLLNQRDGLVVLNSKTENLMEQLKWLKDGYADIPLSELKAGTDYGYIVRESCSGGGSPGHGAGPTCRDIATPMPMKNSPAKEIAILRATQTVSANGGAGRISSAQGMVIQAGQLENNASTLLAAKDMYLSGMTLQNQSWTDGTVTRYRTYVADRDQYNRKANPSASVDADVYKKTPIHYVAMGGDREDSSGGTVYRAVIQAGGTVNASFSGDISNTSTTAHVAGYSRTLATPGLNTLSTSPGTVNAVQTRGLINSNKVAIGSPQWQNQILDALLQVNGGTALDNTHAASGSMIALNGKQTGLNNYSAGGGLANVSGQMVALNGYGTSGSSKTSLNGQSVELGGYTASTGNKTSLNGPEVALNGATAHGGLANVTSQTVALNNASVSGGNKTSLNGQTVALSSAAAPGSVTPTTVRPVSLSYYPLPTSDNGYFVADPDPKSPYLITTNPKLNNLGQLDNSLLSDLVAMAGKQPAPMPQETRAQYTVEKQYLGSSYFLDRLNLHPDYDYRFLGDAAFDTRYVSNALLNETGNRYLNGFGSDLKQMQYLMDHAAQAQQSLGLQFGVSLTAEQIAGLNSSILWWEATTINGQTVMVPKLYLSPNDVTVNNGSVIAGNQVNIRGGNVANNGSTLMAKNGLSVTSEGEISNLNGGLISAGSAMQLSALGDINNIGSTISGKQVALESINGSINNITLVNDWKLPALNGRSREPFSMTTATAGPMASITALDTLSLTAGQNINVTGANLSAGGDLLMKAWGDIAVSANQLTNGEQRNGTHWQDISWQGSAISSGGNLVAQAGHDLTLSASQMMSEGSALLRAGNDLSLNSAETRKESGKKRSESFTTGLARSDITSGGGLTLLAGRDITSQAAELAAKEDVGIQAGRDVNLAAEATTQGDSYKSGRKKVINESVRQQGTDIASGGDTKIIAGRDVTTEAAQVTAKGDIGVAAGRDVSLNTATESDYHYKEQTKTKSGFLSKKTTHTIEENSATREAGSLLSGDNVQVVAGNNLRVLGSAVAGDGDVKLKAGNNVDIVAATNSDTSWRFKEEKKSGLMGSGGIGFTIGSSKSTHDLREKGTTQSQSVSTVGSTGGSVAISAGNQAHIGGADLIAGKDLSLSGDSVIIEPGHDKRTRDETFEQKKSGLTVALSGTVGSAINNAVSAAQETKEQSDGRLKALQATKTVLSGVQAGQAVDMAATTGDPNAMGVSLSLTTQKSKSQQHAESDAVAGSTLNAGNNLSITANGKNKGANSGDIVIAGSQLKAGGDTTLDAQNDILLSGAANTQKTSGNNSSSGGGIGVSIGAGGNGAGISVFANVNAAHGKDKGNGTDWTETTIDSGKNVTLKSGHDTVLEGAQVNGNKIVADVGHDLLMRSQQNNNDYDSKQTSVAAGGSFTFGTMSGSGYINASQDKMKSRFDSVAEQTGLYAGDGGFDITVGHHTQLDGAVIASTATPDKNSLDTGTLGFSDIHNEADFKTSHSGISLSGGGSFGDKFKGNLPGGMISAAGNKGHAEGTTQAAVAEGTLTLRDKVNQKQDVADLSRDTEHANDSISPIFDKEKEQNRLKAVGMISDIGSQVADIARTQGDLNGLKAAQKASGTTLPANATEKERQNYLAELRDTQAYKEVMVTYGTGSNMQRGIQAATAALQGLAGGNIGGALAGASAPELANIIGHHAGIDDNTAAKAIAHAILGGVTAALQGNSAAAGAVGAASGELVATAIARQLYPDTDPSKLTEDQKQTVSTLATVSAGMAGGIAGGNTAGAAAGASAGKNAVENNFLSVTQLDNFAQKARTCEGAACQQVIQDMVDTNLKQQKEMLEFCSSQPDQCGNKYGYLVDQWDVFDKAIKQLDADGKLPNEFKNYLSAVYSSSMEAEGTVANLGWQQKFEALGLDKDTAAAMAATVPAMIAAKGPKGSSLPTPNSTPAANGLNYQSNPKHTPGQPGYSFKAGTEPKNSMDLFGSAVVSGKKMYAKDAEGNVHQFTNTNDGTWHWSGSTGDKSAPLNKNTIPSDVKKQLDLPKKGW
mgnify:CR=1 FL=1